MKKFLRTTCLLTLLATTSLAATAQVATSKILSDQILPKNTYAYLSVPSVNHMKATFEQSSFYKLWNDPAMQDFKSEVYNALETEMQESMLQLQEAVGLSLEELLQIPQGEVSFAFCAGPSNTAGVVVFLDYGENEDSISEILGRAKDVLGNQPRLVSADTSFDGTEITLFEIEYPGKAPTPLAKEFGWFLKDQRMVFSNRIEILESVLQNWDGESNEAFITNDTYSYVMQKCSKSPEKSLSKMFLDPVGLFRKLVTTGSLGSQASAQLGMTLGFLPMLGLEQMKGFGAVSESGEGEFEAITRSVMFTEQPPMALMQAMQFGEINTTPPEWVKENVYGYMAVNWKLSEAYDAIESLVEPFMGGPGSLQQQMDAIAQQGAGIHPKEDVIDQLTGEARVLVAPGEEGVSSDQTLLAFGVRDAQKVSQILMKLADTGDMDTREFRGTTIFEVEAPGQTIQLSTVDNMMLFCLGTTLLEQVLRNDSDVRPLAETEDFKRISEHLPSNALIVNFARPAEQYRRVYDMMRDGTAAEQLPGMDDIFDLIDFSKLPAFDLVSKYIHPTGGYTIDDENGLYIEGFQLRN